MFNIQLNQIIIFILLFSFYFLSYFFYILNPISEYSDKFKDYCFLTWSIFMLLYTTISHMVVWNGLKDDNNTNYDLLCDFFQHYIKQKFYYARKNKHQACIIIF